MKLSIVSPIATGCRRVRCIAVVINDEHEFIIIGRTVDARNCNEIIARHQFKGGYILRFKGNERCTIGGPVNVSINSP